MSLSDAGSNAVLARLSPSELEVLTRSCEVIPLEPGDRLNEFGDKASRLLFPVSGVISVTVPTPEGGTVEVALVGREGVFGVNAVMNGAADLQAMSQVRGKAIAVDRTVLTGAILESVRRSVAHYAGGLMIELAQTAACNRVHNVEERTARWLLHAVDRAGTTDLHLTHEFLAMMLGVRRASVTVVVGGFVSAGLIVAERRRINVADRDGLKEYACGCYEIIRAATAA
jgi:CRP-like cAMP-binding protein